MSIERGSYQIPVEVKPVVDNFETITNIVRPSGKEGQMRNWLIGRALKKGFEPACDKRGNLAINLPASPGLEGQPRVVMQGHMDMVTFKGKNDVRKTRAYITDDGWIRARGETTLGADNGIGIAMALEVIENAGLQHGPMTLLCTVHEETDPMGALQLDPTIVPRDAKILLNLDCEEGAGYICKSSTGAHSVDGFFEIGERENLPEDYRLMSVKLSHLEGAHSGTEIHEQRGNAIKLMNALLLEIDEFLLAKEGQLGKGLSMISKPLPHRHSLRSRLVDYSGGEKRNSIPADAKCEIGVPAEHFAAVERMIAEFTAGVKFDGHKDALVPERAKDLKIKVGELPTGGVRAISDEVKSRLLEVIEAIPNGVFERVKTDHGGGVTLSNNIGAVGIGSGGDGEVFEIQTMARGLDMSKLLSKTFEIEKIMSGAGAKVALSSPDESWVESDNSPALKFAIAAGKRIGLRSVVFPYNAVLECGAIVSRLRKKFPTAEPPLGGVRGRGLATGTAWEEDWAEVSAISIGPEIKDAHSKHERVNIQSVVETMRFIRAILGEVWGAGGSLAV